MIRHRMNAAGEIGAYWHQSHHTRRLSNMMKLVCLAVAVLAMLMLAGCGPSGEQVKIACKDWRIQTVWRWDFGWYLQTQEVCVVAETKGERR